MTEQVVCLMVSDSPVSRVAATVYVTLRYKLTNSCAYLISLGLTRQNLNAVIYTLIAALRQKEVR